MGGRPKNSDGEPWQKYARRARELGKLADQLQAELLKPARLAIMTEAELMRLRRLIAMAQKAYEVRASHRRPVIKKRGLSITWPRKQAGEATSGTRGDGPLARTTSPKGRTVDARARSRGSRDTSDKALRRRRSHRAKSR